MFSLEEIQEIARKAVRDELYAIEELLQGIDDGFARSVKAILQSEGRVIVTGIGKSANIGSKIVSTLNSTGTPAIFMHAADAIHGDLGIIRENDVVICLSKSGETPEVQVLVPLIKARGNQLIALVGNRSSYLAKQADYIIDSTVSKEACPNNLAPTSSTTAQLVMGDALAICLLKSRGFSMEDFAKLHPGGALGKKMYLRVSDLSAKNEVPYVHLNDLMQKVIMEISSKRLGATIVLDDAQSICGIVTDGDLRRALEKNQDVSSLKAVDIMSHNPKQIDFQSLVIDALSIMRENNITQLAVTKENKYSGIIHLHDILKEGIL